jgi:hypothetical protein
MAGRAWVPAPLPPLHEKNDNAMELLESLRLLVILESGMPLDDDVEREVVRFLNTDTTRVDESLACYAVPIATCLAAVRHPGVKHTKLLKEKADELMEKAMKARDITDADSPLIVGSYIQPMWFANQLWRSLACRASTALGIKYNHRVWESDLMDLSGACQKERGWMSGLKGDGNPDNDLNSNLLAMTAISLALESPGKTLGGGAKHSLDKRLKYVPKILRRLVNGYPDEKYLGGRLCLVSSFRDDFSPKRSNWKDWFGQLVQSAVENIEPAGGVNTGHNLMRAMGLDAGMDMRFAARISETALGCLALCGGFMRDKDAKKPLKGMKQSEIDAAMQSLSILHAASLPTIEEKAVSDLEERVNRAIDKGCDYLEDQQGFDGTFPGDERAWQTAICGLALLHGGRDRDDASVKHAMQNVRLRLSNGLPQAMVTYEVGMILMFYQKYYEPEQEKAGMLEVSTPKEYSQARNKVWGNLKSTDQDIIRNLVKFLNDAYVGGKQGGWNYSSCDGVHANVHSDHSISQYGMCGYKSAGLLGAAVKLNIFQNEAERLVEQYGPERGAAQQKWKSYDSKADFEGGNYDIVGWDGSIAPGGWGYIITTRKAYARGLQYVSTGMMILAMARDELRLRGELTNKLHRRIDMTIFGAQLWLGDHFYTPAELVPFVDKKGRSYPLFNGSARFGLLYNMYAVERGCVTADYPLLKGELNWYRILAEALVNAQDKRGAWGSCHDTAVAILILRRAAPTQITNPKRKDPNPPKNPVTEGPKRKVRNPVTGNTKKKKDVTENEEPEPDPKPEKKPDDPITPGKR